MKAQSKVIARIALLLVAVAILVGVAGRSASAEPIDINSGSATVARALCAGSGGNWTITNNVFFCTNGGGHGWACDMDTNPVVCWNFLTAPHAGVKGGIGVSIAVGAQIAPTSVGMVDISVAQAAVANVQIEPSMNDMTPVSQPTVQDKRRASRGSARDDTSQP